RNASSWVTSPAIASRINGSASTAHTPTGSCPHDSRRVPTPVIPLAKQKYAPSSLHDTPQSRPRAPHNSPDVRYSRPPIVTSPDPYPIPRHTTDPTVRERNTTNRVPCQQGPRRPLRHLLRLLPKADQTDPSPADVGPPWDLTHPYLALYS